MTKIAAILIWIYSCALSLAEESDAKEIRVLISETSEVKMDYLLTPKTFTKNSSHERDFGKVALTVPDLVKVGTEHIMTVQLAKIAPNFYEQLWSSDMTPEDRDGQVGSFPGLEGRAQFWRAELCRSDEFLYWRLDFRVSDFIGAIPHITSVVCYLNGEVAEIVDHKKEK